ncbi:vitamin B12 transporter BtuB [Geothrix limicola]|uniref:Vitamin B12 transporter BtuB n=1 Tax=Geothrix limicola TaxID=2927978 RepID=A0ABQ5QGH6_9BACT|nr:TonB-dependent receptor [Geothrix limicola]GLH73697.1 vitamin B12 transporter BtuB [Geothrix limicola]
MGHSRILFTLAALSVVSPAALAARSNAAEADRKPGEATVTVSAEAQPVEVTRTPSPVRVVEADELARLGSRTLAELLEVLQPGAVMSTGTSGATASAFLNGTLSRNVVVLLDGLRLNDPTALSPDLGALSLVGIARVELVLGPSSVLYGSDAIGGAISLTSLGRGAEGFHGQAGLKVGTDGLRGTTAQVQLSDAKGWIAAGGEATQQNNGFPGDAFHQAGGFLRLGAKLGDADLAGFYRNSGQTASVPFTTLSWPGSGRDYQPGRETRARQESWGASLRWPLAPGLVLEDTLQALSGHTGDPDGSLRQQTDRDFRRVEDQLTLHWTPTSAFRLSGRLEGREDTSHAENYYDPSTFSPVRYRGEGRDLAGALESRWTLFDGLDWVAGLRRDAGHRDLTRLDSGLRSRAGSAEAGTWRSGLNWVLAPELRLYASAGQGFRMPNTTEFALNAQAEAQDAQAYPIAPERSRTLQVGATGLFAGHWEYRLEAQRTRIDDLLAYVYDTSFAFPPLFTSHYANQGSIRAQSLEGALGWRGGSDLAYGWDLILRSQETRDLDHNVEGQRYGQQNTAIVRHPFFTGAVSAFLQSKSWRADLRFDRVGPRYDLNDTTYDVISTGHPYQTLHLGFSIEPVKHLSLALRGDNLLQPKLSVQDWLDGRYDQKGDAALVYGFPAPEPRWSLAATWRW